MRDRQAVRDRRVLVEGRLVSPVGEHGVAATYSNHFCRCWPCVKAHRERIAAARGWRRAATADNGGVAPTEVHGASAYSNWGCRCPVCREAWNADARSRRAAG